MDDGGLGAVMASTSRHALSVEIAWCASSVAAATCMNATMLTRFFIVGSFWKSGRGLEMAARGEMVLVSSMACPTIPLAELAHAILLLRHLRWAPCPKRVQGTRYIFSKRDGSSFSEPAAPD